MASFDSQWWYQRTGGRLRGGVYLPDSRRSSSSIWRQQQPGRCTIFDGTNDYIAATATSTLRSLSTSMSAMVWVRLGSLLSVNPGVFCHWDLSSSRKWAIAITTDEKLQVLLSDDGSMDSGHIKDYKSNYALAVGTWYHCAFTWDGTLTIYLNGIAGSTAGTSAFPIVKSSDDSIATLYDATSDLTLGRFENSSSYFPGRLFDARIYSGALTATQIANIYRSTSMPGGRPQDYLYPDSLVSHWKLDERQGYDDVPPAYDSSDNGHHGARNDMTYTSCVYEGTNVPISWENEVGFSECVDADEGTAHVVTDLDDFTSSDWTKAANTTAPTSSRFQVVVSSDNGYITLGINEPDLPDFTSVGFKGEFRLISAPSAADGIVPLVVGLTNNGASTVGRRGPGTALSDQTWPVYHEWTTVTASNDLVTAGSTTDTDVRLQFTLGTTYGAPNGTYVVEARNLQLATGVSGHSLPLDSSDITSDVYGQDATYTGPVPRDAKIGGSACGTFDGSDDGAYLGARLTSGSPTALSFAAWVKRDTTASNDAIMGEWDSVSGNYRSSLFYLIPTTNTLRLLTSSDGTNYATAETRGTIDADGNFHHVAVTVDASRDSGSEVRIFIDGVLSGCGAMHGSSLYNTTAGFAVGNNEGSDGNAFDGSIHSVVVGDSAWTDTEVADLYENGTVPSTGNILGYWPFSEKDGDTAHDTSGNGEHLTLTNHSTSTFWADTQDSCHYCQQYGFGSNHGSGQYRTVNGSDQLFRCSSSSSLQCADIAFALAVYVRPHAEQTSTRGIFTKYDTTAREWALVYNSSHQWSLNISYDGTTYQVSPIASSGINTWDFVFAYHDPTTDKIGISVNGGSFSEADWSSGCNGTGTADAMIGNLLSGGSPYSTGWFDGDVALAALLKPPGTYTWSTIRDAIYNSGTPLRYDQLTESQISDWGPAAWYDCNDADRMCRDSAGSNDMQGAETPTVPGLLDGTAAADENDHYHPAGSYLLSGENTVDFTGGVDTPWKATRHRGYHTSSGDHALTGAWSLFSSELQASDAVSVFCRFMATSTSDFYFADMSGTTDRLIFGRYMSYLTCYRGWPGGSWGSNLVICPTDVWHEVLWTYTGETVGLWVDGTFYTETRSVMGSLDFDDIIQAGILIRYTSGTHYLPGIVDRYIVSNAIETPKSVVTSPKRIFDWRFDDGRTLIDHSGNNNHWPVPSANWAVPTITLPTAYQYGDALPDGMSKSVSETGPREYDFAMSQGE